MSDRAGQSAGPAIETIESSLDVTYSWAYQDTRQQLRDLYEKAKLAQWIPEQELDFSVDVDLDKPMMPEMMHPLFGSEIMARMTCLLYTSDAADERSSVDLGGRRIIK